MFIEEIEKISIVFLGAKNGLYASVSFIPVMVNLKIMLYIWKIMDLQ